MRDDDKDKTAGKFAWFCVGAWLGTRGVPRVMHIIYIAIIFFLLAANALQAPDTLSKLLEDESTTELKGKE